MSNPLVDISLVFTVEDEGGGFDYQISVEGKYKDIYTPNHNLNIWPGSDITVTNLSDPSKTADFNLTGTGRVTYDADGNQYWDYNGWNAIWDPQEGWRLAVGHFEWIGDAEFNTIQPLEGNGQLTDLWTFIA